MLRLPEKPVIMVDLEAGIVWGKCDEASDLPAHHELLDHTDRGSIRHRLSVVFPAVASR
jgi:hypothetical protein